MDYIYVMVYENEWEDTIVFLSLEDAIKESINNPNSRVEIFAKKDNENGFKPTYNYYENGKYIQSS